VALRGQVERRKDLGRAAELVAEAVDDVLVEGGAGLVDDGAQASTDVGRRRRALRAER
jgi:hypothetical protein